MKEIIMPNLGVTMEEGTVVRWLKQEGDQVEKGEILLEIETDKATNEIEASHAGVLGKIVAKEGETVPVLQVIGFMLEEGEAVPEVWPEVAAPRPIGALKTAEPAGAPKSVEPAEVRASPIARRLAEEKGINLALISGSGAGGSITKADVLALEKSLKVAKPDRVQASPRARRLAREKGVALESLSGTGPGGRITEQDVLDLLASQDCKPLSRLKQITARRMVESFSSAPHFYLKIEVDASQLVAWRERLLPAIEADTGVRLTYTDMLVLLTARALQKHSLVNATWQEGGIRTHPEINIGIAAAVEDGLTVPVIKDADKKSAAQIATERSTLMEKAGAGRLGIEDLEGDTFTITNLGMFGIDEFAAIINPPQSAILAVGRIADRVVARKGKAIVQPTLRMVLSIDHRVLDGVLGANFLMELKGLIEAPETVFGA
jgi:pyruvate dehydrogenase E2 component (dihydrolipoamide acetyltransferase)